MRVLIVEDQAPVAQALSVLFDVHEIPSVAARSPEEALRLVRAGGIGVVLQDMNFRPSATGGEEGVELFRALRRLDPDLPVLLMTAWTSLENAVQLVKEGASDYLAKPWDDAKLVATVRNLLRLRSVQAENARLRQLHAESRAALAARYDLQGLVYESAAMHRVVSLALQVAGSDVPILVTGPNGAGKERIAEIVQASSRRKDRPFVRVNAGALPDQLLESELFGAEAGAFTGATRRRIGRFEAADGGTLFLDEIGTVSPQGQVRLLRVLQSGEFSRLGSSETLRADVRLICATNLDLRAEIAAGRFREDLYFRLNVVELKVPGLSERPEDILPLAESFLEKAPPRADGSRLALGPAARHALLVHLWPGNVRELHNVMRRAALVATGDVISPADLGLAPGNERPAPSPSRPALTAEEEAERGALEALLVKHEGSVSRVAAERGLSRQALYRRMDRLGIVLTRRPRD